MVNINELKLSDSGNTLFLNASVQDNEYYEDVYISEIYIFNSSQMSQYLVPDECTLGQYAYKKTYSTVVKETGDLQISANDLMVKGNFSGDLWFVYIRCAGTPKADTPCGLDNEYTIGFTYNAYPMYVEMMAAAKEMTKPCVTPKQFIDSFLRWKALDVSLKSGHHMQAIDYWKWFYQNKLDFSPTKSCGCNG